MLRVVAAVPGEVAVRSLGVAGVIPAVERAQNMAAALYEERGQELLHFALLLARDEELAKDALQEGFMRYFVALSEGKEIASPRAWIYRVMHNYLLDRMKEARHRPARELRRTASRNDEDIERECFRQQLARLFRSALTAREYDCLQLRAEGLRYEEIASRLDLASGTVGALICRAIRKIRDVVTPGTRK